MYVTYGDYKKLGYSSVPKEQFARYSVMAEKTAKKFAAGHKFASRSSGGANISIENKRGLCEIIDLYYSEKNQTNKSVAGFSNENYREQYFQSEQISLSRQIWDILSVYFTKEQLYRGV